MSSSVDSDLQLYVLIERSSPCLVECCNLRFSAVSYPSPGVDSLPKATSKGAESAGTYGCSTFSYLCDHLNYYALVTLPVVSADSSLAGQMHRSPSRPARICQGVSFRASALPNPLPLPFHNEAPDPENVKGLNRHAFRRY